MSVAVPSLDSLDFKGKRVLMRCDFNVPQQDDGSISDDTRIRAALPTIQECLKRGASRVVLMSHLGRPKGVDEKLRLAVVGRRLAELLGRAVVQLAESTGPLVEAAVENAPTGAVILLENVRFHPSETKGDPKLAAEYAKLGDVFVNDAFGTSHPDHAPMVAQHARLREVLDVEDRIARHRGERVHQQVERREQPRVFGELAAEAQPHPAAKVHVEDAGNVAVEQQELRAQELTDVRVHRTGGLSAATAKRRLRPSIQRTRARRSLPWR
jgi:3-phosphoglycerate kinase